MAKISPASIKYSILAEFSSEGPLEKPDVIGALFGQTEGLLGNDMELRELQKEGKIGRIEVDLNTQDGKTTGEITIPSALDKTSTTIIAAALETIDKIGPTDATIKILEVEDTRGSKRDYIMERAKQLLGGIKGNAMESQEIGQELRESQRTMKITSYGDEKLPAGDLSGKEVIVVEGRADVVNMLKHNINNVIGMNGTRLPKEITTLGEEKELTLFVDGDRGGKLIAQNVMDNAKVAYITQAPDGKEVEELAGKELRMALRKKVKAKEFFSKFDDTSRSSVKSDDDSDDEGVSKSTKTLTSADREKLSEIFSDVKGRNVLVLSEDLEVLRNVPASKLNFLKLDKQVWALMVSTVSQSVVSSAEKLGARYVVAKNFGKVDGANVELVSI
jgi:DNA primase